MGQALRRYYRGATLAAMEEVQTGRRLNYHFDHQGTVQCLTDDTGAVTDRFASDAWGVPVKRTGTSINRQWYVGNLGYYRQVDQALDYVRARWLRHRSGRWLSVDPSRADKLPFGYGLNGPARNVDPSGLICHRPPVSHSTQADFAGCVENKGCSCCTGWCIKANPLTDFGVELRVSVEVMGYAMNREESSKER